MSCTIVYKNQEYSKEDFLDYVNNNTSEFFESGNIYYSLIQAQKNKEQINSKIKDKLYEFLNRAGFSIDSLNEYANNIKSRGKIFNVEGIEALVDMAQGIVALKEGASDYAFVEEVAHIAIEMLPMDSKMKRALELVKDTPEYIKYKDEYTKRYKELNKDKNAEEIDLKVRKEVLGKLVADKIFTNNKSGIVYRLYRTLKSLWDSFVNKLKQQNVNELISTINNISDNILESNFKGFSENFSSEEIYFSTEEENIARKTLKSVVAKLEERLKNLRRRKLARKAESRLSADIDVLRNKLDQAQEEEGLIKFLGFLREDVSSAKDYIDKVKIKELTLSSKQIKYLQDFIEYYSPLLHELRRAIQRNQIFENLPEGNREELINMINSYRAAFDDITDFYTDVHAEIAQNNVKSWFREKGLTLDFDIEKAFKELKQDAWALQAWFGNIRDVSSNIARVIYGMIGEVIQKVNRQATINGRELIEKIINQLGVKDTSNFGKSNNLKCSCLGCKKQTSVVALGKHKRKCF